MKIGILGAGTWGIALARMLCNTGHVITVWSALPSEIEALSANYTHPNLPGMSIPREIRFTEQIGEACAQEMILFAVPSVFVRSTARKAAPYLHGQIVVDVAKGIEPGTLMTMSQILQDELGDVPIVALSGPTHAEEVAKDIPTTIVSASVDMNAARVVQDVFMNTCMRVYTTPDVLGVELAGALKNIIALAAGVCSGLGFGDNTKAALITRGLAEIIRLGVAMGCSPQTFAGLAGIGDLIVTATSVHSRNNRCGMLIGQGVQPEAAVKQVGMVVEGVNALPAAMQLRDQYQVEMPIITAANSVVHHHADPRETVIKLMTREKKTENEMLIPADQHTDMKRVMAIGTFDELNITALNYLKHAKALGDYLIVGMAPDAFARLKPILEALRCVDHVIPLRSKDQLQDDLLKQQIDVLVLPEAYANNDLKLTAEGIKVTYLPLA